MRCFGRDPYELFSALSSEVGHGVTSWLLEGEQQVVPLELFRRWQSYPIWQTVLQEILESGCYWFNLVLFNPNTRRYEFRTIYDHSRLKVDEVKRLEEVQRLASGSFYREGVASLSSLLVEGAAPPHARLPLWLSRVPDGGNPRLLVKVKPPFLYLTMPASEVPGPICTDANSWQQRAHELTTMKDFGFAVLLDAVQQYLDVRIDDPERLARYFVWLLDLPAWRHYVYLPVVSFSKWTEAVVLALGEERIRGPLEAPRLRERILSIAGSLFILESMTGGGAKTSVGTFALASAAATIMSRNMSHNIGSHVLSRLGRSEEGGAWYTQRYLQQRMDFLAQVSTEWPTWTEPAWLLQDLVRWFLHQQDLLENIARSEQLGAHRFRSSADGKDPAAALEHGDIRLHVFMVPEAMWSEPSAVAVEKGEGTDPGGRPYASDEKIEARVGALRKGCLEARAATQTPGDHLPCKHEEQSRPNDGADCRRILLYTPATGEATVRTDEDAEVAIPGGIVGYHAFYVILENVLRNAAKHGNRKQSEPLHVVAEIFYDPDWTLWVCQGEGENRKRTPCTLVRLYDSASPVAGPNGVKLWRDGAQSADAGPQGKETPRGTPLNEILQLDIIDESGKVRHGNWGLCEMRIAAAYLQGRTVQDAGGGGDRITGPPRSERSDELDDTMLKAARSDTGSPHIIRAVKSPIGTLGYEFYLLRPRVLGILPVEESEAGAEGGVL